jgi:EPS-associated MarR family transcriptional regulator
MIEYKVIREIEQNPFHTQRSLAGKLDVSLGKINYVLSGLAGKGLIKAKKLKNHPGKIRWQYALTPRGMKEKLTLTRNYLSQRLAEYERLQREIDFLKQETGKNNR